jgi:capsular polysaccharide biosynthesis protein
MRALRRRWWIVLGLVVVGAVGSLGYLSVAHKVYTASASVYVSASGPTANQISGGRTSGAVNMDSEAQVVQSMAVATLAAQLLHTTVSPTHLTKQISVTVPANSQILQISCQEGSPTAAAACAEAFAHAYLQNRTQTAVNQLKQTYNSLHQQILAFQRAVAAETQKITTLPPNSSARADAQAQLKSDDAQLSSLSNQAGQIASQQANTSGGQIITGAVPPAKPTSPKKLLILPSGIIGGLVLGLVLALIADRRDKRVRNGKDLERHIDLPVLLTIAQDRNWAGTGLAAPRSRAGHAFAELAHMTTAALGDGNHVIAVTSASPGTGASMAAANLAAAFSRTHSKVILVCADLTGSVAPGLFHLAQGRGLADVIAGAATAREAMQRSADHPRLWVLPPGMDAAALVSDFQHDVTHQLISELRRSAPVVIIEVPGADSDAFPLAQFVDAALMVAETGKSTWPDAEDCVQRLDRLRTMVLGAVLVPPAGRLPQPPARIAQPSQASPARGPAGRAFADSPPLPPAKASPAGRLSDLQWDESADKGARS